jgi:hypothetical protein
VAVLREVRPIGLEHPGHAALQRRGIGQRLDAVAQAAKVHGIEAGVERAEVALDDLHALEGGGVAERCRHARPRVGTVASARQHGQRSIRRQQAGDDLAADEAGGARHEDHGQRVV